MNSSVSSLDKKKKLRKKKDCKYCQKNNPTVIFENYLNNNVSKSIWDEVKINSIYSNENHDKVNEEIYQSVIDKNIFIKLVIALFIILLIFIGVTALYIFFEPGTVRKMQRFFSLTDDYSSSPYTLKDDKIQIKESNHHNLSLNCDNCNKQSMNKSFNCLADEWACKNKMCIPIIKRCDGHMNCYDHSDEFNCDCDLNSNFHCGSNTSCLPIIKKCDKIIDCWDMTDELNCINGCPSDNEFMCNSGQCIIKSRFCDGFSDCSDDSDEPIGCKGNCTKYEFTCRNKRCISKKFRCNDIDDCGDESDENYCKKST